MGKTLGPRPFLSPDIYEFHRISRFFSNFLASDLSSDGKNKIFETRCHGLEISRMLDDITD